MLDISKLDKCPICNKKLNCYTSNSHFVTKSYIGIRSAELNKTIYFDHVNDNIYEIRLNNSLVVLTTINLESIEHMHKIYNKIVKNMVFI